MFLGSQSPLSHSLRSLQEEGSISSSQLTLPGSVLEASCLPLAPYVARRVSLETVKDHLGIPTDKKGLGYSVNPKELAKALKRTLLERIGSYQERLEVQKNMFRAHLPQASEEKITQLAEEILEMSQPEVGTKDHPKGLRKKWGEQNDFLGLKEIHGVPSPYVGVSSITLVNETNTPLQLAFKIEEAGSCEVEADPSTLFQDEESRAYPGKIFHSLFTLSNCPFRASIRVQGGGRMKEEKFLFHAAPMRYYHPLLTVKEEGASFSIEPDPRSQVTLLSPRTLLKRPPPRRQGDRARESASCFSAFKRCLGMNA